jgi:opacity protein-like surface antigen
VDRINLLFFRAGLDFSIAPNAFDYLLPYFGAGISYGVLEDADKNNWLSGDNQEEFLSYTLKAGFIFNPRTHLVVGGEGQYHWSYALEDYMIVGTVGYQF